MKVRIALALLGSGWALGSAASTAAPQRKFPTPQVAADTLIQAASDYNVPALLDILGPNGKDLISSEDPTMDRFRAAEFVKQAREKHGVRQDSANPNRAALLVGNQDWPLPIPLVKQGGSWHFDTQAGRDEMMRRRIGANELDAIAVSRGYVEAQEEYAETRHDDARVNQYAQRIISSPGKHDGLAWRNPDGTWGGPVGPAIAKAIEQGYTGHSGPFHGYYFKVLKGQGPAARMGALDYVIKGAMIGGFALQAWPAQYGVTGIKTFIVNYEGKVYQRDLGPDTARIAVETDRFNPTVAWKVTNDDWDQRPT
jgi:hypothetical protein